MTAPRVIVTVHPPVDFRMFTAVLSTVASTYPKAVCGNAPDGSFTISVDDQ